MGTVWKLKQSTAYSFSHRKLKHIYLKIEEEKTKKTINKGRKPRQYHDQEERKTQKQSKNTSQIEKDKD